MGTTHTVQDRLEGIRRFVNALDRDPSEWEPFDLVALNSIETRIGEIRGNIVQGLRDSGYTDSEIADALGVQRAAVSKRWPGGGKYVGAAGRYRQGV